MESHESWHQWFSACVTVSVCARAFMTNFHGSIAIAIGIVELRQC